MLSSSIYGSQKATSLKKCIFVNYNTFVRLVLKKEHGVKATAVGFLINVFDCLFKSVLIFALSLLDKKLQLFQYWYFFVFASIFLRP
jgi:hypothetical protein